MGSKDLCIFKCFVWSQLKICITGGAVMVLEISSPLSKIATRIHACAEFSIQNPHQKCAHVRILVAILGQWT